LASLAAVDLIVIFEEDTPMELIRELRPQLLVKGDDYHLDEVVGADFVTTTGGEVLLAKIVPGYSTTATIARLAS
jgi:D-beta-D-heptose 7-phosphate kinase/D-beta-D-heptose 1-phosphate adenosyltransferase